jgi:hypothetical protein
LIVNFTGDICSNHVYFSLILKKAPQSEFPFRVIGKIAGITNAGKYRNLKRM